MKISDKVKDLLAEANGTQEERSDEVARERISRAMHVAEELAVIRKTVKYILEIIAELHDGEIDTKRFDDYNERIEKIVAQAKKEYSVGAEFGKISDIMSEEKK